jgi:hypothetical protein
LGVCKAVNKVINNDKVDINVSSGCMNRMVTADRQSVTVTGYTYNMLIRICKFNPGSKSQSPAVCRMNRIAVDIRGEPTVS